MDEGNGRPQPPQDWRQPGNPPQGFSPQQAPYPQPGGYPQQPGYPQPGGPPQQTGYPQPIGYARQGGYPAQPGYPRQTGHAQPGQPGNPAGPLTLPGSGAAVIGAGFVLTLVGLFALPWAFDLSFLEIGQRSGSSGSGSFFVGFASAYVHVLGFLLVVCQPLATLPWTLGAVRTQKSARWLSNIRGTELTHGSFGRYRTVFTGRATVLFLLHVFGIFCITDGDFGNLGLLQAGPWILLTGAAIIAVGTAVGPRKGPSLPA